jgi:hypothetical protein
MKQKAGGDPAFFISSFEGAFRHCHEILLASRIHRIHPSCVRHIAGLMSSSLCFQMLMDSFLRPEYLSLATAPGVRFPRSIHGLDGVRIFFFLS